MLSEAYGGDCMEKSSVFALHKWFKVGRENVKEGEENAHHFLRYQAYCWVWIHSTRPNNQLSLLCGNTEAVT
jgi:hypothetical protein